MQRFLRVLVISFSALAHADEQVISRQQKQLRGNHSAVLQKEDDRTIVLRRAEAAKYHTAAGYRRDELKKTKKKSVWRFLMAESELGDPRTEAIKEDAYVVAEIKPPDVVAAPSVDDAPAN